MLRSRLLIAALIAVVVSLFVVGTVWVSLSGAQDEPINQSDNKMDVSLSSIPYMINYQGYLKDKAGNPITDTLQMNFSMWSEGVGGTQLWTEIQSAVSVNNGQFNVLLGSVTPIPSDAFDNPSRWLEIGIAGDTLSPRQRIASVGYAFRAAKADSVGLILPFEGSVESSSPAFSVTNTGSGHGLRGSVSGSGNAGVIGTATNEGTDVTNYGGHFEAKGGKGLGVYGSAPGSEGYGGHFVATGKSGTGVFGYANFKGVWGHAFGEGDDVTNYGGVFEAKGGKGRGVYSIAYGIGGIGVYGRATNAGDVTNYGGQFEAMGKYGRGVFGIATGSDSQGIWGQASGANSSGVVGKAYNEGPDVTNNGGHFEAKGGKGRGVLGTASGSSGIGVYGTATNAGDVTNYGGQFEAKGKYGRGVFGIATGSDGRGIWGEASGINSSGVVGKALNEGDVTNYGGVFEAKGGKGTGVHSTASGTNGTGVYSTASGIKGIGVYGRATSEGPDLPNYGGQFDAMGKYGRGVFGVAAGSDGVGVFGTATNEGDAENYGGYFEARGSKGQGVFGTAVNTREDVANYGGFFKALGGKGSGVYGEASNGNGENYGGYFIAKGSQGRGVYGEGSTGVYGKSNKGGWGGWGIYGESTGGPGVRGDSNVTGVYGEASSATGEGVYGYASFPGPLPPGEMSYGGYFVAKVGTGVHGEGSDTGVYGKSTSTLGKGGVYGEGETGVYGYSTSTKRPGVYGKSEKGGYGVKGEVTSGGYAVYGVATGSGEVEPHYAGYFDGRGDLGCGILAKSGKYGYACDFYGPVIIRSREGDPAMELGVGFDYAEGFDVSEKKEIGPGTVLIIDPDNPGKLAISEKPYDSKVAGIVAGAKGLGSAVRLGAGKFDYDVALAGRVYCNVDATEAGVEPGDLLTTSATPGYAMKATDYARAQGAILGKAMEKLEKGQRGQILVLVTLQ